LVLFNSNLNNKKDVGKEKKEVKKSKKSGFFSHLKSGLFDHLRSLSVMDSSNNNTDVLSSDTEATLTVNESPPIDFIDLTEEELEDQMIAVDDYNAIYKRSLAIREMFPSLNDNTCWTGKWQLKPDNLPDMLEVKRISEVELYTDEEIDWDNWNAALNLALRKIAAMQHVLRKLEDSIAENRRRKKRPYCVPGIKLSDTEYECTRCLKNLGSISLFTGLPYPQLCSPKRLKRFHPYIKI